ALELVRLLQEYGMDVCFHDPCISEVDMPGLRSTELTERMLNWADCVVITTDHSTYNYDWIVAQARLIVDTRNATRHVKEGRDKIHTLCACRRNSMAHCLVTGGAGFIGAHLAEGLLRLGHRVRLWTNFSTAARPDVQAV